MNLKIINEDIDWIIGDSNIDWEGLFGKSVLITGATSYLMNYFLRTLIALNRLQDADIKVLCLCRSRAKFDEMFGDLQPDENLKLYAQDVCAPFDISEHVDFIIHAASPANPLLWNRNPVSVFETIATGTMNALQFAESQKDSRFLYISTCSVYGLMNRQTSLKETDCSVFQINDPKEVYFVGKAAGEMLCSSYIAEKKLDCVIARPDIIYGPGMRKDMRKAFTDFLFNALDGKPITIRSDGKAIRNYCYIADCIKGLFYVLLNGETGEAYNIATNNEPTSIIELAEIFADIGNTQVEFVKDDSSYLQTPFQKIELDTKKLESMGWKPTINIHSGVDRTLRYYSLEE